MRGGHARDPGSEGPRSHHHEFTHVVLCAIAFRTGSRIFSLAETGHLTEGLRGAWERTGAGLAETERISPLGLAAVHTRRGSLEAAVILLPQPMRSGEAYLACAARTADPFLGPDEPRYFMLTDDRRPRGRETEHRTRLWNWTPDGRRFDLGEGPLPGTGALLDAVSRVWTIGS